MSVGTKYILFALVFSVGLAGVAVYTSRLQLESAKERCLSRPSITQIFTRELLEINLREPTITDILFSLPANKLPWMRVSYAWNKNACVQKAEIFLSRSPVNTATVN